MQIRAAESVAAFVAYCYSPEYDRPVNPCDKVIKNLFTFLCSDTSVTPVYSTSTEGIVTLRDKGKKEDTDDQLASKVTRRGAQATFKALATVLSESLFDTVPKIWDGLSVTGEGQDLVDSLTSLRLITPEIHPGLHSRLVSPFPAIISALQSPYAVLRNTAATCLATLCDVVTDEGMKRIIDDVVPLVGDAKNIPARQGAVEAIHRECISQSCD